MSCIRSFPAIVPILLLGLLRCGPVEAAVYCVDSIATLRSALAEASTNGENDVVALKKGHYQVDELIVATISDNRNLILMGGAAAGGCQMGTDPNPTKTALDGNHATPILSLYNIGGGDITVRNLTFLNGRGTNRSAVTVFGSCGSASCWSGKMTIERNQFIGNSNQTTSNTHPAIFFGSADVQNINHGLIRVANNVFDSNTAYVTPIHVRVDNNAGEAGYVYHNTVYNNWSTMTGASNIGGMRFVGTGLWRVTNNIFWGNSGNDMQVGSSIRLSYNNIQNYIGVPLSSWQNRSVNPEFTGELHLRNTSPMIDAGMVIPSSIGGNGELDAWASWRTLGAAPDIGAHEWSDEIFWNGFDFAN